MAKKREFRIREMREAAGYSQQEVADILGIRKDRYGDWERETNMPNLKDAINMADIFHCSLDELAGRKTPEHAPTLTDDEQRLVDAYQASDDGTRRSLMYIANGALEHADESARKNEGIA